MNEFDDIIRLTGGGIPEEYQEWEITRINYAKGYVEGYIIVNNYSEWIQSLRGMENTDQAYISGYFDGIRDTILYLKRTALLNLPTS